MLRRSLLLSALLLVIAGPVAAQPWPDRQPIRVILYVLWIGAFAPAATRRDIVQRLHDAITKALADPDVASAFNEQGAEPMPLMPEQFDDFIKREIERNAALVAAVGIPRN